MDGDLWIVLAALWFSPPTALALYVLTWGTMRYGAPNRNVFLNIALMYMIWPWFVWVLVRTELVYRKLWPPQDSGKMRT